MKEKMEFTQTLEKVKGLTMHVLDGDSSGHDYWHNITVFENGCNISNVYESDGGDLLTIL